MSDREALEAENASLRHAIRLIHQVANLLRASLELEPACQAVLTGVSAGVGLGFNRAMLFLTDESRESFRGALGVGPSSRDEADRIWRAIEADDVDLEALYRAALERRDAPRAALDARVRALRVRADGDDAISCALRSGQTVLASSCADDLHGLIHPATGIAAPLRGPDGVCGVLYADNAFTGDSFDPIVVLAFELIADHAGRAIDNARRYERIASAARTDALTGLGHHGALMDAVEGASTDVLSFLMIDLDDFKQVNDVHGHLAGDALLVGISERLQNVLRADGTAYRYGGEEFGVVLPGVGAEAAYVVAERIRTWLGAEPFNVGTDRRLSVTCSVGVATRTDPDVSALALIGRADDALLRAKRDGKNQVVRSERLSSR